MTTHSLVLGFTAETAMHAGASTSNHVIDLPIMREHNTGWPGGIWLGR
jgi:CRISPR/Cas system CMR subunit Cmr4 (Cas7 group RAMP superfamily)